MPKNPSLAAALQGFDRSPNTVVPAPSAEDHQQPKTPTGTRIQAPSRRGKKALIGYFDPSVSLQLKQIALEEGTSIQHLLGEAINLLFQCRGKPTVAQ